MNILEKTLTPHSLLYFGLCLWLPPGKVWIYVKQEGSLCLGGQASLSCEWKFVPRGLILVLIVRIIHLQHRTHPSAPPVNLLFKDSVWGRIPCKHCFSNFCQTSQLAGGGETGEKSRFLGLTLRGSESVALGRGSKTVLFQVIWWRGPSPGHTWIISWPYKMSKDLKKIMCDLTFWKWSSWTELFYKKEPISLLGGQLWLNVRSPENVSTVLYYEKCKIYRKHGRIAWWSPIYPLIRFYN